MTADDPATVGFEWGRTDGTVWLRNDDGEYKRVEPAFVQTLRAVASGERPLDGLSERERTAFDHLADEDFFDDSGTVRRVPMPEDVPLRGRLAAFGTAFALLTAYVGYRFTSGTSVPTVTSVDLGVLEQLLLSIPMFVAMALVHEGGHYLAARPYFDATIRLTRVNGVFPALVTETNDAWRCPRNVRIWINLAGPFVDVLQCLVLAALSLFVFPGSYLLAVVPVFEYFRVLFSMNPLVRGDGYWMVVDWFGATNLYSRGLRDLKNAELTTGSIYAVGSLSFTVVGACMMAFFVARMLNLV